MTTTSPKPAPPVPVRRFAPLENGDHLSVVEFERRYDAMPNLKKAELVDGIVFMNAAVSGYHGEPHGHLITWLGLYRIGVPGVQLLVDTTVRFNRRNVFQPDGLLRVPEGFGGRSLVVEGGYVKGPPELVAEVAASTVSLDLHRKLETYRRQGVPEYVVWRVHDEELDWFVLRNGAYERMGARDGLLRSTVFPGLWLDSSALLKGDLRRVQEVVQLGLATPEHAAFVAELARRRAEKGGA